jgi:hypothetical protein
MYMLENRKKKFSRAAGLFGVEGDGMGGLLTAEKEIRLLACSLEGFAGWPCLQI